MSNPPFSYSESLNRDCFAGVSDQYLNQLERGVIKLSLATSGFGHNWSVPSLRESTARRCITLLQMVCQLIKVVQLSSTIRQSFTLLPITVHSLATTLA